MTMLFVAGGRVAVAFHDEVNPTAAEWNDWITLAADVHASYGRETRAVILTLGGAPNAAQRSSLGNALGGKGLLSAVLTNSTLTRGAVTAISWLGVPVRAFKPDSWTEITAYLELTASETSGVQAAITRFMYGSAGRKVASR